MSRNSCVYNHTGCRRLIRRSDPYRCLRRWLGRNVGCVRCRPLPGAGPASRPNATSGRLTSYRGIRPAQAGLVFSKCLIAMPTEPRTRTHIKIFDYNERQHFPQHFGLNVERLRKTVLLVGSRFSTAAAYLNNLKAQAKRCIRIIGCTERGRSSM
jgi:hypothetical protein